MNRKPSVGSLRATFHIAPVAAREIRKTLARDAPHTVASAKQALENTKNTRGFQEYQFAWRFHGVLEIFSNPGNPDVRTFAVYLNTGETYETTILYQVRTGDFLLCSWGDWLEREERAGRLRVDVDGHVYNPEEQCR